MSRTMHACYRRRRFNGMSTEDFEYQLGKDLTSSERGYTHQVVNNLEFSVERVSRSFVRLKVTGTTIN